MSKAKASIIAATQRHTSDLFSKIRLGLAKKIAKLEV